MTVGTKGVHARYTISLPPLRRAMILYVSWLVLAAASAVVVKAQSANCTDSAFNWVSAPFIYVVLFCLASDRS